MIFISKEGKDPYMNQFALGCHSSITSDTEFEFETSADPIILRGILKHKIMKKCWKVGRTFYYVDTGYFGNEKTFSNPNGWKYWHRIVKDDLQHNEIISRPDDRFKKFNKVFLPWKKKGRKILIAKPDEKPMKFYGLDLDQWLLDTLQTLKQYTDRPIEIRERKKSRLDRISTDTLQQALDDDVFALVTFNSVAAVESIFHGIPVFALAPTNAAAPVALKTLSKIETPYYPDKEKLHAWGCHLAYGQFHIQEMRSGKAMKYLKEWW